MKAVILAAGVGSRLRPLTHSKPTCLVRVCGKALIDYQLDAYATAGVDEVVLVAGYRADAVAEHVRHRMHPKVTLVDNPEFESTNSMYSLSLARDFVHGEPFFLNNADLAVRPDVLTTLAQHPAPNAVAVAVSQRNPGPIDFYKLSAEGSTALFHTVDDFLGSGDVSSRAEAALRELVRDGEVDFVPTPTAGDAWVKVQDFNDLMRAERAFSSFDSTLVDTEVAFIDLDGTIFAGAAPIPGAAEAIERVRRTVDRVYFLSNNSSRDKAGCVHKLAVHGIAADEEDIVLSSDGALEFLAERTPSGVFVLGTEALRDQAAARGLLVTDRPDEAEYVLVGSDTELTYAKLAAAAAALNAGADMVVTHPDVTCPTEHGLVPDAGALAAMLTSTTGREPLVVMGKPDPQMVRHLLVGVDPSRVLVVGDHTGTDMLLARRLGAQSVLVLSGETNREHVEILADYPSAVVPSIDHLGITYVATLPTMAPATHEQVRSPARLTLVK